MQEHKRYEEHRSYQLCIQARSNDEHESYASNDGSHNSSGKCIYIVVMTEYILWCEHVVVAATVDEGPEELIHQVHLSPALFNYASGADSVVKLSSSTFLTDQWTPELGNNPQIQHEHYK